MPTEHEEEVAALFNTIIEDWHEEFYNGILVHWTGLQMTSGFLEGIDPQWHPFLTEALRTYISRMPIEERQRRSQLFRAWKEFDRWISRDSVDKRYHCIDIRYHYKDGTPDYCEMVEQ